MIITKIEPQKRINRVNIYIDGSFAFGLEDELRYKYDLHIGKELDKNFINTILKSEEYNKVLNTSLNFLSYRQRSEKELVSKLKNKGYEEADIMKAVGYCKSQNYINDKEFAISYIRDKTYLNKLGSNRIKYELFLKGISEDLIDEVLDTSWDEEYKMAFDLATKKIKSYKNDNNMAKYRKLGGFLQRKGYSYDIVSKVLKELIK